MGSLRQRHPWSWDPPSPLIPAGADCWGLTPAPRQAEAAPSSAVGRLPVCHVPGAGLSRCLLLPQFPQLWALQSSFARWGHLSEGPGEEVGKLSPGPASPRSLMQREGCCPRPTLPAASAGSSSGAGEVTDGAMLGARPLSARWQRRAGGTDPQMAAAGGAEAAARGQASAGPLGGIRALLSGSHLWQRPLPGRPPPAFQLST